MGWPPRSDWAYTCPYAPFLRPLAHVWGVNVGQFQNFMVNIWLVVSTIFYVHNIWDVIRNPLTNSIIFQDGYCTTNQMINGCLWIVKTTRYTFHTWSIWMHFSGWAKLQVRRNWLSDPGNTEHSSWCRWEIPELEVWMSMDWFVGDNLNRKPWIFPWRSWGFPVIVPLNQCIGNGTISVNFHCQLRLRLRGKGCDLVHHLENFGKIGTVWTCF